MTEADLKEIRNEIASELNGRRFGKVFQLGPMSVAIDFHPHSGRYLFISYGPRNGSVYLIRRRLKELEKTATHQTPFTIHLRQRFSGLELVGASVPSGNGLLLEFAGEQCVSLAVQTGSYRPNLFILDEHGIVVDAARAGAEEGQQTGSEFEFLQPSEPGSENVEVIGRGSLSDLLDAEEQAKQADADFDKAATQARQKLAAETRKRLKLIKNLESDLLKHGEPERWKRYGDLLLANIGNIRRQGDKMIVKDFYDSEMPDVEIPCEPNATPSETAEMYFRRYAKARNGAAAIAARLETVNAEIGSLQSRFKDLERIIGERDRSALAEYLPKGRAQPSITAKSKKDTVEIRGARRFISSDGFEILVGKKAADNDHLTFRVARSLDLWFHAADYPGSHVIVRNPARKEIPNKTLIQAAQLAAFYSDAREMPKVSVRYTPRKFVNKPRRAAPGLVSLASFKTILVEPGVADATPAN